MSLKTSKLVRSGVAVAFFATLLAGAATAQDEKEEKLNQEYSAFGVSMTAGVSGVLQITIDRYSTDEERAALLQTLTEKGQEKMVDQLRKMKQVGFARTQTGAGMRGWPSTRIHYAHQVEGENGKRTVMLVTDRNMSMAEQMQNTRSVDYDVSAIVMELEPVTGDKKLVEKGSGLFYRAVKLTVGKDNKLKAEFLGQQPIRLPDIKREK